MSQFQFEWDPVKAKFNIRKHGVRFEESATIFNDPNMLSIYDEKHSDAEERWMTLGLSTDGGALVVVHTYEEIDDKEAHIRIISSRKATKKEMGIYEEQEN